MDIKLQSFNAVRAMMYGKAMTLTEMAILLRSAPHTHSEIQFSARHNNISWSATRKGGFNCVRFLDIGYSHIARWDTVVIPMTDAEEDRLMEFCVDLEGTPYDLLGLLSFTTDLPIIKPHKYKMWCSEACTKAICEIKDRFALELIKVNLPQELSPAQLDTMARHVWR